MIARCLSSGSAVAFRLRGLLFLVGAVSLLALAVRSSQADPMGRWTTTITSRWR